MFFREIHDCLFMLLKKNHRHKHAYCTGDFMFPVTVKSVS